MMDNDNAILVDSNIVAAVFGHDMQQTICVFQLPDLDVNKDFSSRAQAVYHCNDMKFHHISLLPCTVVCYLG